MGPFRQGNSASILYSVLMAGVALDIAGWTFEFRVKQPGLAGFVIDLLSTGMSPQIIITNPTAGSVTVSIIPGDTAELTVGPDLYEFIGTDASGDVYTLDSGNFNVTAALQP
jgi:hypothetical protein